MSYSHHLWVAFVFSIALAIVLASPGRSPYHDFLQKRAVDLGCYTSCTTFSTLLSAPNCSAVIVGCLCDANVAKALVDCCNCGVSLSPAATAEQTRQQYQSSLTSYAQSCKSLGVDVGVLTITVVPNSAAATATGCVPDVTNIFPTIFPFV